MRDGWYDADFGQAAWHGNDGPVPIRQYHDDDSTDVAQVGLKALYEGARPELNPAAARRPAEDDHGRVD